MGNPSPVCAATVPRRMMMKNNCIPEMQLMFFLGF